tara:strand:- start:38 stop:688 length:651 start_codon:yes stop_codon:yes gene_type:complete
MSFKDKFFQKSPLTSHGGSHADPTDNYKKYLKQQEQRKAEIESLKNVISSQKEKQTSYDKKLKEHEAMAEDLRLWGNWAKSAERGLGDYTPEVEQAIKGNVYDVDDPKAAMGFHFTDKSRNRIAITGGDFASSGKNWHEADYAPKPKGERPVVDAKAQKILQEKLKAFEEQEKAGFKEKPKQSVIKDYEVYAGPRYNPETGKVERYTTTSQYRTKE